MMWIWATLASWLFLLLSGIAWLLTAVASKHNRGQERYENTIGQIVRLDVYRRRTDLRDSSDGNSRGGQ